YSILRRQIPEESSFSCCTCQHCPSGPSAPEDPTLQTASMVGLGAPAHLVNPQALSGPLLCGTPEWSSRPDRIAWTALLPPSPPLTKNCRM
uniref:Potassium voltage-gated channel subfamily C member 2 n=1 Tax=Ascaris lumbricoides TaxID=6252 RepID=A0A0M3IQ85_ASCLU